MHTSCSAQRGARTRVSRARHVAHAVVVCLPRPVVVIKPSHRGSSAPVVQPVVDEGVAGSSSCAGFAARSSSQTHPKPWTACKLAALRSRNGGDTVAAPRQEAVEAPPLADGGELTLNCDLGGPTAHRDREHCSSPRCAVFSPPAPCQPARPRAQEDLHPRRRQCRRLTYPCVADLCRRVIVVRGCAQPQYGRNGPTALARALAVPDVPGHTCLRRARVPVGGWLPCSLVF